MRSVNLSIVGVCLLFGANDVFAADLPLRPGFNAEVRMERTAIGLDGRIAKEKVYAFTRVNLADAADLVIEGTIEQKAGHRWTFVASFSCGYGPVPKGETRSYSLYSCNVTPLDIYAAKGRPMRAILDVKTPAGITPLGISTVKTYPPGPTFP